jgi:NAD(P)-dependent dehydrogenase (short-subunit alcohol dehydrogenase family)
MSFLVTGGASGIGAATAKRLAARGPVVVADRNVDGARKVAADISSSGGKAAAVEVDVSSSASVAAMMRTIERDVGQIDGLFNNAGITKRQRIEDITEEAWDAIIATHVKGVFLVSRAVLPQMVELRRGVVVNTASDFSVVGAPGAAAYAAAKTAIYAMTKAMAVEFTHLGIRVNAIGPGPIDTPLLRVGREGAELEAALERNRQRVPMKRLGQPEEVAAVVDFLMSERSSYIAGQIIHPNGGAVMW